MKILTSVLAVISGLVVFYKYMTYDRSSVWSKEFEEEIKYKGLVQMK